MSKKNDNTKEISFLTFIKAKEQRLDWIILLVSCIVGYSILIICYPYPATMSDSGTYVASAAKDFFTFYRPFGFSYFLQIIHFFSSSIHAVFISQMLLYFLASSMFSFTIKYFFPPANRVLWNVLLFFFVFNPMMFYMANAIMSDFIFAIMIYFMLSSFFFIFKKQSWFALGVFLLSLYCSLHIRYSAIVFPVLFICFFLMIKGNIRWVSIITTLFVTLVFYSQMKNNMKEAVGLYQYSTGFDGWQLANNGIHVLPFVNLDPNDIKDKEIREVHSFMIQHTEVILQKTSDGTNPVAAFMWLNDLPLKQYLFYYIQTRQQPYPISWVKLGSGSYKKYGNYLITRYPLQYMKHYYLPNAKQIFYPSKTGLMGTYTPIEMEDIQSWYKIPKEKDVNAKYPIYENFVADFITIAYLIIWIVIAVTGVLAIVYRKKLAFAKDNKRLLLCIILFGVIYYTSTVFASPIELRFWLSMAAVQFSFIYILLNQFAFRFDKKD